MVLQVAPSNRLMHQTRLTLFFLLCFICSAAWGIEPFYPRYLAKDARADAAAFRPDQPGVAQFMRAVRLGRFHIYKPGEEKEDLDSAYNYYRIANKLANQLNNTPCKVVAMNLLGAIAFERSERDKASTLHEQAAAMARKTGDLTLEAECWYLRGEVQTSYDTYGQPSVNPYYQKSLKLFQRAKNVRYQAYVLARIAGNQNYFDHDYSAALANLLESLRLYKSIGYPRLHYVYFSIMQATRASGMYAEALRYGMLAIESARATNDLYELALVLSFMGKIHDELEEQSQAMPYYKLSIQQAMRDNDPDLVLVLTRRLAKNLMKAGKVKEAKAFFTPIFAKYPPDDVESEITHLEILAYYHTYIGDFDNAEKYIRKYLTYENTENGFWNFPLEMNENVGNLYLKARRYDLARKHLEKASKWASQVSPAIASSIEIQKALYKVDSAQGNYASALEHFSRFKVLSDSIFSVRKSLQIAGLQIQFDTRKKEQDILNLTQQNKVQLARLEQREFQRNAMIGGTVMLSFLLLSLYVQFRGKQKSNQALKLHQQVIEDSNARLTRTVEEKQLLVKEIHHRVKNNLQTVISLLESQAFYLENDALTAVKASQNRIHAMSLIHQKLYLADHITSINMQAYIQELVTHLSTSHCDGSRISISLEVDLIYLDVAQAIPLGLIINEAVTNIFKYAFPDGRPGKMRIRFNETPEGFYILKVSDNGIGLRATVDEDRPSSLGMRLMKGLSYEMEASFIIESDHGVSITVQFAPLQHILEIHA